MIDRSRPGLAIGRRLVVKIGSAMLVDGATGAIRRDWLEALAADVVACRARGQEVLIVSSGAVAVGRRHLKLCPPGRCGWTRNRRPPPPA